MWPFSYFFILSIIVSTAGAFGNFSNSTYQKQKHLVTGVEWEGVADHVPIRREVRDLKDNYPAEWNLYLLGLRALFNINQSDPISYVGISGIHGKPFQSWQDAVAIPDKVGKMGYCPHGNILFFGWHRSYLALFEQELHRQVQALVPKFPDELRKIYAPAAQQLRIPYWDWALGEKGGPTPDFFAWPEIEVRDVDGATKNIANPLYRYDFHPLPPESFEGRWLKRNHTVRWPTSDEPEAESQNEVLALWYMAYRSYISDNIATGFTSTTSFNDFSRRYLESIHGLIHQCIGGTGIFNSTQYYEGHMWPVAYSAYEPLFWLNHANVDRLYALYQAAFPTRWLAPSKLSGGTLALPANSPIDADTPLAPFWRTQDSYWTTNAVRNTTALGYAYPETQHWNFATEEEYRASVNATIARLYSASARQRLAGAQAGSTVAGIASPEGVFLDWAVRCSVAPMQFPATFRVQVLLADGDSEDDFVEVGSWVVLGLQREDEGEVGEEAVAELVEKSTVGYVGLTGVFMGFVERELLEGLEVMEVLSLLSGSLEWRVFGADGTPVSESEWNALEVLVVSSQLRIPVDPDQPLERVGEEVGYPEITAGMAGGAVVYMADEGK
ncbi:Di-copper centre-containing protein [Corynespora cassiicola Philippines]|uniref:tyrosinase n=1 Tax=Corynespora cassiicola Philippines TaxID=1448308 RepID=A0A2T2N295_CORCC|nr:Di-copper centre-containing protein [Corynespora cassiicola Philippines]